MYSLVPSLVALYSAIARSVAMMMLGGGGGAPAAGDLTPFETVACINRNHAFVQIPQEVPPANRLDSDTNRHIHDTIERYNSAILELSGVGITVKPSATRAVEYPHLYLRAIFREVRSFAPHLSRADRFRRISDALDRCIRDAASQAGYQAEQKKHQVRRLKQAIAKRVDRCRDGHQSPDHSRQRSPSPPPSPKLLVGLVNYQV